MTALLDTHTFLWAASAPEKIGTVAARVLLEAELYLSYVSVWEIVIKCGNRKLTLPTPPLRFVLDQARRNRIDLLEIGLHHLHRLETLPLLHRDPFDRMLVAQAQAEAVPIITTDPQIACYDVQVIW